nr:hypothetical protein BdHM001_35220 [Bdellovibrio sp. HM001]
MVKFLIRDSHGRKYIDTTLTREQIIELMTTGVASGRDADEKDKVLVIEGVLANVVNLPVSEKLARAIYALSTGTLEKSGFDTLKGEPEIMSAILSTHEGELAMAQFLPKRDGKARIDSLIQAMKESRAGDRDEVHGRIEALACEAGLQMYLFNHPEMKNVQFSVGFLQEVILNGALTEEQLAEVYCQVVCRQNWIPYKLRDITPKFNKSQENLIHENLSANDAVVLTGKLGSSSRPELVKFILSGDVGEEEEFVAKLLKPTESEVVAFIKTTESYRAKTALRSALELKIISEKTAKEVAKKRKLELEFPEFLSEKDLIALIKRRKEAPVEVWNSAESKAVWETVVDIEPVGTLITNFRDIPKHTQAYAKEKILSGLENSQVASVLANVTGLTSEERSELAEKAVKTISGAKLIIEKSNDQDLIEKAVMRLADSAEAKRIVGQTWPEQICKRLAGRIPKIRKSVWFNLTDVHEDIRRHMTSEQKVAFFAGYAVNSGDAELLTDEEIVAGLSTGTLLRDYERLQKIPTKLLKTVTGEAPEVEVELLRRGEAQVKTFAQAAAILSDEASSESAIKVASDYIVANPETVMEGRWMFDKIKGETRTAVASALIKTKAGIQFLAREMEREEFAQVAAGSDPDFIFDALRSVGYLLEMIDSPEFVKRHVKDMADWLSESTISTFINHSVAYHETFFPLLTKMPFGKIYSVIREMNDFSIKGFVEFLKGPEWEDLRKYCVINRPGVFSSEQVKEVIREASRTSALEIVQAHPELLDDVLGAVLLNESESQALALVEAQVDGWKMLVPILQMSKSTRYAPVKNKEARVDFFNEVMPSVDYYTAQELMNADTELDEVREMAKERFKALNVEIVFKGTYNGELETERPDLMKVFQVESVHGLIMSSHLRSVITLARDKRRPESVPLLLQAKEGEIYATLDAEYVEREMMPQAKINNLIKAKKKALAETQIPVVAERSWSMEITAHGMKNTMSELQKSLKDAGSDYGAEDFKGRPKRGHIKTPMFVGEDGVEVVGALGKRIQEGGLISSASMTIEIPEFNKLRTSKEEELIESIETYSHVIRAALGSGYRRIAPSPKGRGIIVEFSGFEGLDLGSFAKFMVNLVDQMVKSKVGDYQVEKEKMLEMIDVLEKDLDSSGLVEKQELLERISTSKILFAG